VTLFINGTGEPPRDDSIFDVPSYCEDRRV
jgi:hypothetical protein